MRMLFCVLLGALAAAPAAAQDDDLELDWDSIDLDGDKPQTLEYSGSSTQAEAGFNRDARATISLPKGNLKVRCHDGDVIRGGLSFKLTGTDKDAMQRFGDGIRLSAYGEGSSGGIKLTVPSQPSSVKSVVIDLNVVVPIAATVSATASRGWVEVIGCKGFVTASAGKDGAFVKGPMTGFKVSAASGDVGVELLEGSEFTKSSAITATKGAVTLMMGLDKSARLDARGTEMHVDHEVSGRISDTSAAGNIGSGGPSLVIRSGGVVKITASN